MRQLKLLSAVIDVLVLGACVTSGVTTLAALPAQAGTSASAGAAALTGSAPPAPTGWSTVFSDNFAGPAGSAPSPANWFYDIGTGYGTGEVENTTNSTSNVYLDGNGDLDIKAIDNGGTWTSARIESTRDDFEAPAGGEMEMTASIEQPNPANGIGYWPAFWALGSPMRAGGGWPHQGELDMMEDVNGSNEASQTLHDSAGSSGHALIACPTTGCQTGYNTYSVIINRVNTSAEYPRVPDGRDRGVHHHRGVGRHRGLAGGDRPRLLHHLRPGHGRQLPRRGVRLHHADDRRPRPARR